MEPTLEHWRARYPCRRTPARDHHELQIADVRDHVVLSLFADFGNFSVFRPTFYRLWCQAEPTYSTDTQKTLSNNPFKEGLLCKEPPQIVRRPTTSSYIHSLPKTARSPPPSGQRHRPPRALRRGPKHAQFDAFMESVVPRDDVAIETETLGGIPGLWVKPASARSGEAILHLHGGWFNFGSAKAYCHLVGHIAARAGAKAFIPDYRLAPEHPFPAATDDVLACYQALAAWGVHRIVLTGDYDVKADERVLS